MLNSVAKLNQNHANRHTKKIIYVKQKHTPIMSRARYHYLSEIAATPSQEDVESMEASGKCSVNVDGACIPNMPMAARLGAPKSGSGPDVCPQKQPMFCAGGQPYSTGPNGWQCSVKRQGLYQGAAF
jgi:hypothetical protein